MFYLFLLNVIVQVNISKTNINSKKHSFFERTRALFTSLRNIVTEAILINVVMKKQQKFAGF